MSGSIAAEYTSIRNGLIPAIAPVDIVRVIGGPVGGTSSSPDRTAPSPSGTASPSGAETTRHQSCEKQRSKNPHLPIADRCHFHFLIQVGLNERGQGLTGKPPSCWIEVGLDHLRFDRFKHGRVRECDQGSSTGHLNVMFFEEHSQSEPLFDVINRSSLHSRPDDSADPASLDQAHRN